MATLSEQYPALLRDGATLQQRQLRRDLPREQEPPPATEREQSVCFTWGLEARDEGNPNIMSRAEVYQTREQAVGGVEARISELEEESLLSHNGKVVRILAGHIAARRSLLELIEKTAEGKPFDLEVELGRLAEKELALASPEPVAKERPPRRVDHTNLELIGGGSYR